MASDKQHFDCFFSSVTPFLFQHFNSDRSFHQGKAGKQLKKVLIFDQMFTEVKKQKFKRGQLSDNLKKHRNNQIKSIRVKLKIKSLFYQTLIGKVFDKLREKNEKIKK